MSIQYYLATSHKHLQANSEWYTFLVENERSYKSGFSAISMSAMLSLLVLVGAIGWKIDQAFQNKNTALTVVASAAVAGHSGIPDNNPSANYLNGISSTGSSSINPYDPSQIGDNVAATLASDYTLLQANGTYSTTTAAQTAEALGKNLKASVSYKMYAATDIKTDSNTSYARMLSYRTDLQTSLAPLLKSTTPELDMLTKYVQTNDQTYLTQLRQAADTYKLAAAASAQVVVPADAVPVQLGILNAMQEFAATLDQMAANANDPFTEATLINTYMQAQSDMFSSFNNLYGYYKSKQQ